MKKVFIAVLIAALMGLPRAALAGSKVYGVLQYSFNYVDENRPGGVIGLSGQDNISLFGVKGEYGDEIKAFYHLQTGAAADANSGTAFNQRFFMGGLKGFFGKLAYGRMTNAYKFPGFAMDPFYNLSHIGATGRFSAGGASYGLSSGTNGFTDNSLQYDTPSFHGAKLNGGLYVDDTNENEHGFLGGGSYTYEKFKVGVVYAENQRNTATVPNLGAHGAGLRAYTTCKVGNAKVGFSYENLNPVAGPSVNYLYATGTYTIPEIKTDVSASIGSVDKTTAKGLGMHLGAFYGITENTRPYVLFSFVGLRDYDSATQGRQTANAHVLAMGVQHKFSVSTD